MADTKEFDVIRIARSDGLDNGPGYWPASSSKKPTTKEATADKTPRTKPQMMRLAEDDPRFIDWRIKLGILLKQELSPNPDEGNPWYVHFPRGYWLYERSKHLWVSGYPIKAKLFKSPQEFGVHLIWLLSGSKDYKDCSCAHCNAITIAKLAAATEESLVITQQDPAAKAEKIPPKVTPVPLPPIPGQPLAKPPSVSPRTTPVQPPPVKPKPPQASPPAPPIPSVQQPPTPSIAWSLKSPILFRVGELVWYRNGASWRLGIIVASGPGGNELLPIGHGLVQSPNLTVMDVDMRPFHAFSVPPPSVPELHEKVFDEIPWEAMLRDHPQTRDLLQLDASKLAALKIDFSYSLWSPLQDDPSGKTKAYYGCFLGAERVEIGDSLRIKDWPADVDGASELAVLGLLYIYTTSDNPGVVFLRGNVYVPRRLDNTANIPVDESLPVALREEQQWRNQFNTPQRLQWSLVKENVVLQEQYIRGRFYPTPRLMPILNPAGFHAAVAKGQVDDQYAHLNNRMDGAGRYIGRMRSRVETLGAAVAHGARLAPEPHVKEEGPYAGQ